ncbi:MAG: hypothetical protein U1C54_08350, partial [Xanthomonadaceae bacterium]|nr:hypothetical protein [Xanthomonadaceae bacterium]
MANQQALSYARERLQMRAASGPVRPDKAADPIIVHPDVRRMLLTNRAKARGQVLYCYIWALLSQPQPAREASPGHPLFEASP